MPELLLLTRRFAGELTVRVGLGLLGMFSALYMLGLVLSDSVPEWIKSVDFLFAFSRALRALPPWDFALIALAIVIIVGYIQRIFQFLLRRRNTLHLKKLSLEDMNASTSAVTPGERRWKMMARGRLLARVMIFATSIGNLLGVIAGLVVFGYYPSAAIITVLLLVIILYVPVAVKKWLVIMEKNENAHRRLAKQLLDGGGDEVETEIHVHTERMLIRAKTPVTRFMIVWPMLSVVFPLAVAAAAIESHMYVLSGVDSSLNKLLLVLMASSIRSIFQTVAVFEALANLAARAVRQDAMDIDEEA
ncbi:MAG: hypothetical protein K9G02_02150 [Microbacteriaceae bacterium]|nr:hypothetical protein [Microbacteriaceae bacterium]